MPDDPLKHFRNFLNPTLQCLGMPKEHITALFAAPYDNLISQQFSFSPPVFYNERKARVHFAFVEGEHEPPWPFYIIVDDDISAEQNNNVMLMFPCEEGCQFFINIQRRSKNDFVVRCTSGGAETIYLPFMPQDIKVPAHSWFLNDTIFTPKMRKLLLRLTDKDFSLPGTR